MHLRLILIAALAILLLLPIWAAADHAERWKLIIPRPPLPGRVPFRSGRIRLRGTCPVIGHRWVQPVKLHETGGPSNGLGIPAAGRVHGSPAAIDTC